jgi:hypothetical protein
MPLPRPTISFYYIRYKRLIYIDADHLALRNCDDLFELEFEEHIAATLEAGSGKQFQCGMYVFKPSSVVQMDMIEKREDVCSYEEKGVDTGFMNCYYRSSHKVIPEEYNLQHFCNSRGATATKCKIFSREWWGNTSRRNEIRTVHDKFFMYLKDGSNEITRLWHDVHAEMLSTIGRSPPKRASLR